MLPPLVWSPTWLQSLSHLISRIYDIIVLSLSWLEKHGFLPPLYLVSFEPIVQTWEFAISEMVWLCYIPSEFQAHLTFSFFYNCNNRGTYRENDFPVIWTFNLHKEVFRQAVPTKVKLKTHTLFRDHQQISFITLNIFCRLSNLPLLLPPASNRQF